MKRSRLDFVTVDVFTQETFGGNPLAVFFAAQELSSDEMQKIAAEMNYSETAFILPPVDSANTAKVRIFTPKSELPFAGHPNVGAGFVLAAYPAAVPVTGSIRLASQGNVELRIMRFEEGAGLVDVEVAMAADGTPESSTISAPQTLQQRPGHTKDEMAAALGLQADQIIGAHGGSTIAGVGVDFAMVQVKDLEALQACQPRESHFQRLSLNPGAADSTTSELGEPFGVYVYCHDRSTYKSRRFRTRMFDPMHGIAEDPATGSAAGALASLLAERESLVGTGRYWFWQGEEISRPSLLTVDVTRDNGQIQKTKITGHCVEVIQGVLTLS